MSDVYIFDDVCLYVFINGQWSSKLAGPAPPTLVVTTCACADKLRVNWLQTQRHRTRQRHARLIIQYTKDEP